MQSYWKNANNQAQFTGVYNNISNNFENQIPVSITGGKMSYEIKGYTSEVADILPLYPLGSISTEDGNYECQMLPGDQKILSHIKVEGYNTDDVPYYGFNQKYGSWVLVDEDGNAVDDSVCSIGQDSLSGQYRVTANGEGVVYAKYVINDNTYTSAQDQGKYVTDSDIHTTYIRIQVDKESEKTFEGSVANWGSGKYYIGEEPLQLGSLNDLKGAAYDETGIEIPNAPIVWELREANGASVNNNEFQATSPGMYHVRAAYQGKWSQEWSEIEVLPARELTTLVLEDNYDPAVMQDQVFDGNNIIDMNQLDIRGLDQYEEDYGNLPTCTIQCVQTEGVSIDQGIAAFSKPGTYEFYVECNGLRSNILAVTMENSWTVSYQSVDPAIGTLEVKTDQELLSGEKVADQTQITINAVPAAGYELVELQVNGAAVENPCMVTITEHTMIQAIFQLIPEPVKNGWEIENGKKVYYENNVKVTGWKEINGNWYAFDSEGIMKSGWQKINSKWYYLGKADDGKMRYGWQIINSKWYYLGKTRSDGAMKYGWKKINNKWYYLSGSPNDGSMKYGLQKIGKYKYYLGGKEDGSMKTGWRYIGKAWYYFYPLFPDKAPEGHMAVNEWIGRYYVNRDGIWTQTMK